MLPQAKQYLYQDQDEQHYFRLSLAIAVVGSHLLPKPSAFGTSSHDALDIRSATASTTNANSGGGGGSGKGGAGGKASRSASVASTGGGGSGASNGFPGGQQGHSPETHLWSLHPAPPSDEAAEKVEKTIAIAGALWGLHEDRLVVRAEEARADAAAIYAAFHRANPLLYPKTITDASPFQQRYAQLMEDPVRMRLVNLMPEDTVTQLDNATMDALARRWAGFFTASASTKQTSSASPQSSLLQKAKASALRAIQRCQQSGKAGGHATAHQQRYRREDLIIHSEVRQGIDQQDIPCCSEDITPQSPLLRDLFAKSTDYQPSGAKKVTLSEKDGMWSSIPDMFSVFGSDNINRFKQFCEAPALLSTIVDLAERLRSKEQEATSEWDQFVEQTFAQRDERIKLMDALRADAIGLMRSKCEAAMKRDIEAIQELYQSHMFHEEATMNRFFSQQKSNLEVFYDREITSMGVLRDLTDAHEPEPLSLLRYEVQAMSELCAETYGQRTLPRLLMLADVLLAGELRSQCLKLIALDFSKFFASPEMNSQLLRANTLRELITLVPDSELLRASRWIRMSQAANSSNPNLGSSTKSGAFSPVASFRLSGSPRRGSLMPNDAVAGGYPLEASAYKGIPIEFIEGELAERSRARADELDRKTMDEIEDLCRRVNALMVRIKHEQASAVVGGGSGGGEHAETLLPSPPQSTNSQLQLQTQAQSLRQALGSVRGIRMQPKTAEELRKSEAEETFYLSWRDLLADAVARKVHVVGGVYNVAVLRVPRGMEGHCSLLPHRRGCDFKSCFRYITAEGQGCVTIGESSAWLYWEARMIFVDTGLRYPATIAIGMDAVPQSLNKEQLKKLQRLLGEEQHDSLHQKVISAERLAKERKDANPAIGPTAASTSSLPPHAWLHNMQPLSALTTANFSSERIVGVTPVDVSSMADNPQKLHGVSWGCEGVLNVDGVPVDIRTPYDVGDRIGIGMNTLTGELKWFKNGSEIHLDRNVPQPRLRRGVAYLPAITVMCSALTAPPRGASAASTAASGAIPPVGGGGANSSSGGGGGSSLHQHVAHEEDTVSLTQLTGALIPKARLVVDFDGSSSRGLPMGHTPFSRGAVPVLHIKRGEETHA